ncbi:MAG: galactokinase [Verrucomicrobiales bacterium]|jgi:galactokinase
MRPINSKPTSRFLSDKNFESVFGNPPTIATRAPGRINLIGEHVDYQDGLVLPAAIDRYICGSARAISGPEVRLWSSLGGDTVVVPLDQTAPLIGRNRWANYVFGVVAKYRDAGHPVVGFEAAFDGNLPLGVGLSSSAALESATALIVEALAGITLAPTDRALLCQAAEHDWAGVPCGIMDQLVINAGIDGHALKIDCRSLEIQPAPLPPNLAIVVADSKVHHSLADGEYAKRKADCENATHALGLASLRDLDIDRLRASRQLLDEQVFRRARHVVTEISRVKNFSAALDAGNISTLAALMAASHDSLRADYEVSCKELDALVEIAVELGTHGSRMMGGGFGGSTVNLVSAEDANTFANQLVSCYHDRHGKTVDAFVVNPVAGAQFDDT